MEFNVSSELTKKQITEKMVLKKCEKLANVLAQGKWAKGESRDVGLTNFFVETIGDKFSNSPDSAHPELIISTKTFFRAKKDVFVDDDFSQTSINCYTLALSVKQSIAPSELPLWIDSKIESFIEYLKDELFDDDDLEDYDGANDEYLPDLSDDDDDYDEDDDSEMNFYENKSGILNNETVNFKSNENVHSAEMKRYLKKIIFEQELKVIYQLDDEDMLYDFVILNRYYGNGYEIDNKSYRWSESEKDNSSDDENLDNHRADLNPITEDVIKELLANIDKLYDFQLIEDKFDDCVDMLYAPDNFIEGEAKEHCKRAMAILALVSMNVKGM